MKYRPKLDPKVDLKGATPESLARALFRRNVPYSRPSGGIKPVVGGEIDVEEVAPDEADNGVPHLGEGV